MKRLLLALLLLASPAWGAARYVGTSCAGLPSPCYTTVRSAVQAASAGDSIYIYPGTYALDHFTSATANLHFVGVGAAGQIPILGSASNPTKPVMDGQGSLSGVDNDKGIWTFTNGAGGTTIDNIEFKNAFNSVANGCGVRADPFSGSLTIQDCYFHDCEMEILGQPQTFLVQYTELFHSLHETVGCQAAPTCFEHCIYVNGANCTSFTIQYCYVHQADTGNEVKSRATNSWIQYNRIADENGTTVGAGYSIDVPDCGRAYIIGNVVIQSTSSPNTIVCSYGAESQGNGVQDVYFVNNTIVNDQTSGGTFIGVRGGSTADIVNNIFYGSGTTWGTRNGSGSATFSTSTNYVENPETNAAKFVGPPDYHLTTSTPASITNAGTDPGTSATGYSLAPTQQYVYDTQSASRPVVGALDIGAFELPASSYNIAPVLTQPSDMTCNENSTCDQAITATDANGDPLTFSLFSISPFMTVSVTTTSPGTGTATGNIHLAPTFSNGNGNPSAYTMIVEVDDASSRNRKTINVTINNVDQAVTFNQPGAMIVTEASTADQFVAAFDPDYDTVTFSKVSGPSFFTVIKVTDYQVQLHLAPSVGAAGSSPYTAVVRASDGTLNTDKTFTIVVVPAPMDATCIPF